MNLANNHIKRTILIAFYSWMALFFAFPWSANFVIKDTLITQDLFQAQETKSEKEISPVKNDKESIRDSIQRSIRRNNQEIIEMVKSQKKQEQEEEKTMKTLIRTNIQRQEILDIDDSKTLPTIQEEVTDSWENKQTTWTTDISLVKKYWWFKWYQQALLLDIVWDWTSLTNLDKTLEQLQIQELTKKYGEINKQYLDVISKKDSSDETYRQLLLSMKLTEKAIK